MDVDIRNGKHLFSWVTSSQTQLTDNHFYISGIHSRKKENKYFLKILKIRLNKKILELDTLPVNTLGNSYYVSSTVNETRTSMTTSGIRILYLHYERELAGSRCCAFEDSGALPIRSTLENKYQFVRK